jgi:hypothetical protein
MLQGIDGSALVLVLVTKKYAEKVNGDNQSDNCQTEFRYILDKKQQADTIVPIVMEPCMRNPKTWGGILQAGVGHLLYKDFSSDNDVADLVKQLRDVLGERAAREQLALAPQGVKNGSMGMWRPRRPPRCSTAAWPQPCAGRCGSRSGGFSTQRR